MNTTQYQAHKLGFILGGALLAALTGCTTYVEERPPEVYVPPEPAPAYVAPAPAPVVVETPAGPPVVVIQTEADFYQPLTPYGRWVDTPDYGRVWVPGGVAVDWRPYANGHWEQTDAGWFWVSDEPWAWATYHYGRWDNSPELGWYWVPQTQWAPAWVSWRRGGGYTGWAPLHPEFRMERGVRREVDVNVIEPRSFVFVEDGRFTEPHRPSTVIINNTEIVNKTVIINHTTIVNKTIVNAGPPVAEIAKSTGRAVPAVAVKDLRATAESHVSAPRSAAPARPAAAPAAVLRPAAPKTSQIRPVAPPAKPAEARPSSPPAKPGAPEKPENKDEKKKPGEP